ncbi:MAG: DNA polymerase ligase N-terminal domain-containing protein [Armatimonadota bacterium]
MCSLNEYKEKRRFDETPEPEPEVENSGQHRFVVQEHHASHLHWDFRLELGGVLASWAVPKGMPEEPGTKRLAVRTEDHPVSYIGFEGEIPEGQYGAGTVKIWDKGTYDMKEKDEKRMVFDLDGNRLSGGYVLVHTGGKNWLLFKRK